MAAGTEAYQLAECRLRLSRLQGAGQELLTHSAGQVLLTHSAGRRWTP